MDRSSPAPPSASAPPLQTDRRGFLRLGGQGLVVLACWPLVTSCGEELLEGPAPPDPTPPGPGQAFAVLLADPRLCANCARCAITCSALNAGGPSLAAALVSPAESYFEHEFVDAGWAAATCHMCEEEWQGETLLSPACVASCPKGAARITELGHPVYGDRRVRVIDPERCDGCGLCRAACPHHHPLLAEGRARKCSLCVGRSPAPPCAEACPSMALRFLSPWQAELPEDLPWEQG